jgi:hypothetical protein
MLCCTRFGWDGTEWSVGQQLQQLLLGVLLNHKRFTQEDLGA